MTNIVLGALFVVLFVLYLMRRNARLRTDDNF